MTDTREMCIWELGIWNREYGIWGMVYRDMNINMVMHMHMHQCMAPREVSGKGDMDGKEGRKEQLGRTDG
jgi:hypothetical protein